MDNGMAQVLESVFGKRELDAVSVEEIRSVLAEFPSFNAGHYLLSRKLKKEDPSAYAAATRHTALYFNNPLWLQLLLDEPEPAATPAPIASFHDVNPASTINEQLHRPEDDLPTVNDKAHSDQNEAPPVNDTIQSETPTLNETLQPVSDEAVDAFDSAGHGTDAESLLDETFAGVNQEDRAANDDIPQPDPMFDDNPAFEWPADTAPDLTFPVGADQAHPQPPETDVPVASESEPEDAATQRLSADLAAAARELIRGDAPQPAAEEKSDEKSGEKFDEKKAKAIVFEPYHTIDYFASQGIKLVLEDNPTDSFGRQLKSFTAWLKTMKRLPVQPLTGKADEAESAEVKHYAADSVENSDILTEAMAEVLVKQGMIGNAVAIYEKLSLINPLKSAYFAARIEQLNASRS